MGFCSFRQTLRGLPDYKSIVNQCKLHTGSAGMLPRGAPYVSAIYMGCGRGILNRRPGSFSLHPRPFQAIRHAPVP